LREEKNTDGLVVYTEILYLPSQKAASKRPVVLHCVLTRLALKIAGWCDKQNKTNWNKCQVRNLS